MVPEGAALNPGTIRRASVRLVNCSRSRSRRVTTDVLLAVRDEVVSACAAETITDSCTAARVSDRSRVITEPAATSTVVCGSRRPGATTTTS